MLESIVHSGFVYFMAAQRAVRRTLIKEFYGSLACTLRTFLFLLSGYQEFFLLVEKIPKVWETYDIDGTSIDSVN